MSLHDELMAVGREITFDLLGTPGGLVVHRGGQSFAMRAILGEIEADREMDQFTESSDRETHMERVKVSCEPVDTYGEPWTPRLDDQVELPGEGSDAARWKIDSAAGFSTSDAEGRYTFDLTRRRLVNQGRSGREGR